MRSWSRNLRQISSSSSSSSWSFCEDISLSAAIFIYIYLLTSMFQHLSYSCNCYCLHGQVGTADNDVVHVGRSRLHSRGHAALVSHAALGRLGTAGSSDDCHSRSHGRRCRRIDRYVAQHINIIFFY